MRPIWVLTAMLVEILPSQAWAAADWVLVSSGENGASTFHVDRNSIHRTGAVVRYWKREDYVSDPDGMTQSIVLSEDNCATGEHRSVQVTSYYSNGRSKTDSGPSLWLYVVPDTIGEEVLNFVCGK